MTLKHLVLCLAACGLAAGCLTGDNYPKNYAASFCSSLFQCVDADDIDLIFKYDDVKECKTDVEKDMTSSGTYDAWEEGKCEFDSDAADVCLSEVEDLKQDKDCDGNMSWLEFGWDGSNSSCGDVYTCD